MNAERYEDFYRAVHGYAPFPWQRRLAAKVVERGEWPPAIALPTSAGKTSVIDIAVFALACWASRPEAERPAPRRIFFVVDRRIVVDEAFARARALARSLAEAESGVVKEVAELLLGLGGEVPLAVAAMRGGMYLDLSWARSPAQPLVCVSTVDQVGSRLLFRGYGLGVGACNTLPIHAALVGNDALIVLDEAHMSRAFGETLAAVARYRGWADEIVPAAAPWQVVQMSATLDDPGAFRENEEDWRDPELGKRLSARKVAKLVEVRCEPAKADGGASRELEAESRRKLVDEVCARVVALLEEDPGARVVGVVVNRVATARQLFETLRERVGAVLLIGPSRPFDRDALLRAFLPRMKAGRDRRRDESRLVVVATQCVEVGADLDFDALVSEGAPLDALRQRFGRLDRLGERGETKAFVLIRSDQTRKSFDDPVYGTALARAWTWLREQAGKPGELDFGAAALGERLPQGEALRELCSPSPEAPVMLPAHLDLWVQTSPIPLPDPDVSLFLHGPRAGPADAQVVWRADLDLDDPSSWADVVALVPPTSLEALAAPLYAVRAWLRREGVEELADVEGRGGEEGAAQRPSPDRARLALRWRGLEESEVVRPEDIQPGDTIVVPAAYRGADAFGWNPDAPDSVRDVGDPAFLERRSRAVLRLHPRLVSTWFTEELAEPPDPALRLLGRLARGWSDDEADPTMAEEELLAFLDASDSATEWARRTAKHLLCDRRRRRRPYPDGSGVVLVGSHRVRRAPSFSEDSAEELAPDVSWAIGRRVSLAEHTAGVEKWVRQFASSLALPAPLAKDLVLASRLHDLGKLDPRFQVMLHGGDEVAAALADEPLAKSGMDPQNRVAWRGSRERARYPRGYRHETASLALVERSERLPSAAADPNLSLHLVVSHHGCARPFVPIVRDQEPVAVGVEYEGEELSASSAHGLERLDSGVADRFWRLVRRYGWYGLAYLEAIMRLADSRQSEAEERGEP